MNYIDWRNDIFGQSPDANPVRVEHRLEIKYVSPEEEFDHIDRALADAEIHDAYSPEQIGIGLHDVYSASDMARCYLNAGDESRRVRGIQNLNLLYSNFFDRYCLSPVRNIGNDQLDGRIGFVCYMFWDIFVVYPGNSTPAMVAAGLDVMTNAIRMKNDNCIASAIHGLGHWAVDLPRATQILKEWLLSPTSRNESVIEYATLASTGYIQ